MSIYLRCLLIYLFIWKRSYIKFPNCIVLHQSRELSANTNEHLPLGTLVVPKLVSRTRTKSSSSFPAYWHILVKRRTISLFCRGSCPGAWPWACALGCSHFPPPLLHCPLDLTRWLCSLKPWGDALVSLHENCFFSFSLHWSSLWFISTWIYVTNLMFVLFNIKLMMALKKSTGNISSITCSDGLL